MKLLVLIIYKCEFIRLICFLTWQSELIVSKSVGVLTIGKCECWVWLWFSGINSSGWQIAIVAQELILNSLFDNYRHSLRGRFTSIMGWGNNGSSTIGIRGSYASFLPITRDLVVVFYLQFWSYIGLKFAGLLRNWTLYYWIALCVCSELLVNNHKSTLY